MKEPMIIYDSDAFQAIVGGKLSKGGIISNSLSSFSLIFLCPPIKITKSDIELTLKFQNNDSVSLFFQKECNALGDISEYDFLYSIYWIFLSLISIAVCVIVYYYIKNTEIDLRETYIKCKNWVSSKIGGQSGHMIKKNEDVKLSENIYDESEIVDIKIKTATLENKKENNYNSFNSHYGGI